MFSEITIRNENLIKDYTDIMKEVVFLKQVLLASILVVILASSLSFGIGGVSVDSDKSFAILSYDSHESISIDGNDDLISQKSSNNWTGSGLEGDPIVISNYIIVSFLNCISITNVTLYFRIESCELTTEYTGGHGISIVTSENGYIFDCYIHLKFYGILIEESNHITIEEVTIHDCFDSGVYVYDSDFVSIVHNNIGWNDYAGVILNSTSHTYCSYNTIIRNSETGIICRNDLNTHMRNNEIGFSEVGIFSDNSNNWVIEEFEIGNCSRGILVWFTINGYILDSHIYSCSNFGIYLGDLTMNMSVVLNIIGPNSGTNAYNDGDGNFWDEPYSQIGNNWSDYSGTGYYHIPGSAGSIDHYPSGFSTTTTTTNTTTTTSDESTTTTTNTTTNSTVFDIPLDVITLAVSIGSTVIILFVMIVIIRNKRQI